MGDAVRIAEIHIVTWRHAYRGIVPDKVLDTLSLAQRTEEWKRRLEPSERRNFVLEMDGSVCGWASIGPSRDSDTKGVFGELYAIYMAPSHIGRSLGQPLYARCEQELIKGKYPSVSVWVLEANRVARRFYEKSGFKADGGRKTVSLGGADLPEIRYSKSIAMSA